MRGNTMNLRMNRKKLNIGAYWLQPYAGTEEHVRDIAACHIDMMVCVHEAMRDTLDHFKTYGVGAVVVGAVPGWWGGNGKSGEMAECNPNQKKDASKESHKHHGVCHKLITIVPRIKNLMILLHTTYHCIAPKGKYYIKAPLQTDSASLFMFSAINKTQRYQKQQQSDQKKQG